MRSIWARQLQPPAVPSLSQDPKVCLSSLVGSSTPRAVERHGPSKLRIGSNNSYLDLAPAALSSGGQQQVRAPAVSPTAAPGAGPPATRRC
jgi:hypothetical protein